MTEATPREMAIIAARAADEKKATDIVVQNVGEIISVTEYFVIVTAANSRQVSAIIDEIEEKEREEAGVKPLHREETRDGSWELLDYGSVVVHVFQPETREFYRLEALWNDAPVLDIAAEAGTTVLAASSGTVINVFQDDMMGTTVIIDHADGYPTTYATLHARPTVEAGEKVSAGQIIGAVGTTAAAESAQGPHLHFSVAKDGDTVDPNEYLKK